MNVNNLAILVAGSIFLVMFAIASAIMLLWEIRHSRTMDEAHKAQIREMIDKIQQLINSIKQ